MDDQTDDQTIGPATQRSAGANTTGPARSADTQVRVRRISPARCVVAVDLTLDGQAEFDLDARQLDAMLAGTASPQAAPAGHAARGRWKFDRKKFFHGFAVALGKLSQHQMQGLDALLASAEADSRITDLRWLAYMLATVRRECGNAWHPIPESGKGKGTPYGKPIVVTDPHGKKYRNAYYGRGYVQLTWEHNYARMGKLLKNELRYKPALALQPAVAYKIMSLGMRLGIFTGKKLADYIHGSKADYVNARRIINGLDHAQTIAADAVKLARILRQSAIPSHPVARPAAVAAPPEAFA
jgi:hypothetical protein